MVAFAETASTDYHAAAGSWEAWVDAKLAEQRELLMGVMAEMLAKIQRDFAQTVLEMRAAARPADGRDGRSLNVRGTYDPGVSYFTLDVAVHDGASWIAVKDRPGPLPGDGWQLVARQGKKGPPGERGERGEKGQDGINAPVIDRWIVNRSAYTATPVYSNGIFGPTLELKALFESSEDKP